MSVLDWRSLHVSLTTRRSYFLQSFYPSPVPSSRPQARSIPAAATSLTSLSGKPSRRLAAAARFACRLERQRDQS